MIEAEGLTKFYGSIGAIRDVSFQIAKFLAILGQIAIVVAIENQRQSTSAGSWAASLGILVW